MKNPLSLSILHCSWLINDMEEKPYWLPDWCAVKTRTLILVKTLSLVLWEGPVSYTFVSSSVASFFYVKKHFLKDFRCSRNKIQTERQYQKDVNSCYCSTFDWQTLSLENSIHSPNNHASPHFFQQFNLFLSKMRCQW